MPSIIMTGCRLSTRKLKSDSFEYIRTPINPVSPSIQANRAGFSCLQHRNRRNRIWVYLTVHPYPRLNSNTTSTASDQ
jgi:hypothetical protein